MSSRRQEGPVALPASWKLVNTISIQFIHKVNALQRVRQACDNLHTFQSNNKSLRRREIQNGCGKQSLSKYALNFWQVKRSALAGAKKRHNTTQKNPENVHLHMHACIWVVGHVGAACFDRIRCHPLDNRLTSFGSPRSLSWNSSAESVRAGKPVRRFTMMSPLHSVLPDLIALLTVNYLLIVFASFFTALL